MNTTQRMRYTAVAIVLHWAIALAIAAMIPLGWWMDEAAHEPATQAQGVAAIQLHKSVGLTILALSLARLGWRLMNRAPPLPAHMPAWERLAAKATHWGFYALIVIMPLTGWLYVSTGWSAHDDRPLLVPTLYFNLFEVPRLLGLAELDEGLRSALATTLNFVHSKLAWVMIGLAALHVGAALKHHFFDQDDVLVRMAPGLKPLAPTPPAGPAEPGRRIILIAGAALIVLALGSGVLAFTQLPRTGAQLPAELIEEHAAHDHEEAAPLVEAAPDDHAAHPHEAAAPAAAPTAPAAPGAPPVWRVDQSASAVRFSGVHAGAAFEGRFESWRADIRFDADNLPASSAIVTIDMASARDGVALHEQSLPEAEWFDTANHPDATFRTVSIRAAGAGRYEAHGTLTLKGKAIEIALPFSLSIQGERAVMNGRVTLDRAAADLGQTSDPDGEWVSQSIDVIVHVEAARAP